MPDEAAPLTPAPRPARQAAARLAFGAALVLLALWTFAEYLPALGWAGVIAIATWPFYQRLRARLGEGDWRTRCRRCSPSSSASSFLAPVVGAGWFLGREAKAAAHWLDEARKNGVAPPEGLDKLKYVGPSLLAWWRENLADPAERGQPHQRRSTRSR